MAVNLPQDCPVDPAAAVRAGMAKVEFPLADAVCGRALRIRRWLRAPAAGERRAATNSVAKRCWSAVIAARKAAARRAHLRMAVRRGDRRAGSVVVVDLRDARSGRTGGMKRLKVATQTKRSDEAAQPRRHACRSCVHAAAYAPRTQATSNRSALTRSTTLVMSRIAARHGGAGDWALRLHPPARHVDVLFSSAIGAGTPASSSTNSASRSRRPLAPANGAQQRSMEIGAAARRQLACARVRLRATRFVPAPSPP